MSDYYSDVSILRGQMADMLARNEEQFVFVLTNAIKNLNVEDAIEQGALGDEIDGDVDKGHLIISLRQIANAIETDTLR